MLNLKAHSECRQAGARAAYKDESWPAGAASGGGKGAASAGGNTSAGHQKTGCAAVTPVFCGGIAAPELPA